MRAYICTKIHTRIFIIALFIIAKLEAKLKTIKIASLVERINKHTMEQCSELEGNALSSHGKARRKLRCLQLSERGSDPTLQPCGLLEKAKLCQQEERCCQGTLGEGREGIPEHRGF